MSESPNLDAPDQASGDQEPPAATQIVNDDDEDDEFVEMDPSGRYGRYGDLLGKGASKKVYRGFDTEEGIEVAWNQADVQDMKHIQSEVNLLKTFKHKNIIKLYCFWVDMKKGSVNFITELCSGTLLAYRKQHKHVCLKAVKDWARQILRGLVYLHSQNPPIIHRDLKCENIFINCSSGKVKIGDFGSATVLHETRHHHSVIGTPEFIAPEMYEEDYNELVDVYAFGMCMLQLLTLECPYGECKSLAQVYKKVTAGLKPKSLEKVKDFDALRFISKCLAPALQRPSASDLQADPFLQCEGSLYSEMGTVLMKSASVPNFERLRVGGTANDAIYNRSLTSHYSFHGMRKRRQMEVTGKVQDETTIFMRLRISEPAEVAPIRNIEFPFDLHTDTPKSVAEEMVQALKFSESDSIVIGDLIASVIATLMQDKDLIASAATPNVMNLGGGESRGLLPEQDCGTSACVSDPENMWPLSSIDISQRMSGNQLCVTPAQSQFGSQVPSYLKAIA